MQKSPPDESRLLPCEVDLEVAGDHQERLEAVEHGGGEQMRPGEISRLCCVNPTLWAYLD